MNRQSPLLASLIILTACGGGGGGGSDSSGSGYTAPTNNPPAINNTNTNISVEENQTRFRRSGNCKIGRAATLTQSISALP